MLCPTTDMVAAAAHLAPRSERKATSKATDPNEVRFVRYDTIAARSAVGRVKAEGASRLADRADYMHP